MVPYLKKRFAGSLGLILLILAVISGSAFAYWGWGRTDRIVQPIAFNHRAHVTNAQIQCSECHAYYSQGAHSGLPNADTCMACHSDALTKSPEEAKLREGFQRGNPPVFRKLFHLPAHVYYSHRRHVVLGKLECIRCHGQIADTEAPPLRPLVRISMDFCTGCHTQSKVTNDCKSCHR
jgi:hypothetical protein